MPGYGDCGMGYDKCSVGWLTSTNILEQIATKQTYFFTVIFKLYFWIFMNFIQAIFMSLQAYYSQRMWIRCDSWSYKKKFPGVPF
jgi:hypothetical protein